MCERERDRESKRVTRWRRPIGCLKLKAVFRQRATTYRAREREWKREGRLVLLVFVSMGVCVCMREGEGEDE